MQCQIAGVFCFKDSSYGYSQCLTYKYKMLVVHGSDEMSFIFSFSTSYTPNQTVTAWRIDSRRHYSTTVYQMLYELVL